MKDKTNRQLFREILQDVRYGTRHLDELNKLNRILSSRKSDSTIEDNWTDENIDEYIKNNYNEDTSPVAYTESDVKQLRTFPRKSINDFTDKEIQATSKWAKKFYRELGNKSPFLRAWFGDWREHDTSSVQIEEMVNREGKNPRGMFTNADTGWEISSSNVLMTNHDEIT